MVNISGSVVHVAFIPKCSNPLLQIKEKFLPQAPNGLRDASQIWFSKPGWCMAWSLDHSWLPSDTDKENLIRILPTPKYTKRVLAQKILIPALFILANMSRNGIFIDKTNVNSSIR